MRCRAVPHLTPKNFGPRLGTGRADVDAAVRPEKHSVPVPIGSGLDATARIHASQPERAWERRREAAEFGFREGLAILTVVNACFVEIYLGLVSQTITMASTVDFHRRHVHAFRHDGMVYEQAPQAE